MHQRLYLAPPSPSLSEQLTEVRVGPAFSDLLCYRPIRFFVFTSCILVLPLLCVESGFVGVLHPFHLAGPRHVDCRVRNVVRQPLISSVEGAGESCTEYC